MLFSALPLVSLPQCSLTCGAGVRRRNVTCSWSTGGAACDPHRKPSATASCHARDCPVVVAVDHFGGEDASGSGWTSKEAVNEINSIPDVDPNASQQMPGARAQPRAHDGLNNAIDAEFTRRHHVDKGHQPPVEKNVKVDDFYYDYNFINFHEDLSYDAVDSDNSVEEEEEEDDGPRLDGVRQHMMDNDVSRRPPPIATSATNLETPQDSVGNGAEDGSHALVKTTPEPDSMDVFPEDDYFLPVSTSTTPSATPCSPTGRPHAPQERPGGGGLPGDRGQISFPRQEPAWSETPEAEAPRVHGSAGEDGTLEPVTSTPANADGSVTAAQEMEDSDYFEKHHPSEKQSTDHSSQGGNANTEPPLASPSEESAVPFQTAVPRGSLDLSRPFPTTAFMTQDADDGSHLGQVDSAGQGNSEVTARSSEVTSESSSQASVTASSDASSMTQTSSSLPTQTLGGPPPLPLPSTPAPSTQPRWMAGPPAGAPGPERTEPDQLSRLLPTPLDPPSSYRHYDEVDVSPEITTATAPPPTRPPGATPATTLQAYWVVGNWSSVSSKSLLPGIPHITLGYAEPPRQG